MRNYVATIFCLLVPSLPAYAGTCDTTSTTGLNTAVGGQRACWHMDESAGATTMQDDSGFGNNGSLTNVTTGHASNPPCYLNLCYEFAGQPSVAVVPHSDTLNPGASDFSFSAWINTTDVGDDFDLVRKGRGTSGNDYKMELKRNSKGQLRARCYFKGSNGSAGLTKGPHLADGLWHLIVCTKKSTSIQMQVDGRAYSKTVTIGSVSNSADLTVGAQRVGTGDIDQYLGLMDEVSVSIVP